MKRVEKKRIFALFLAVTVLLTVLSGLNAMLFREPESVYAAESSELKDFEYSGNTIKKYIGNAAVVVIPSGFNKIEAGAFRGCDSVVAVDIPEGVTILGSGSFQDCNSLNYVGLPSTLDIVWHGAFSGSWNISDVYYNGSVERWKTISFYTGVYPSGLDRGTIHYNSSGIPEEVIASIGDKTFLDFTTDGSISTKFGSNATVTKKGDLYMWGHYDDYLNLEEDVPHTLDFGRPYKVLGNVKEVALGQNASFYGALTNDNDLYMWGNNTCGELGDGTNDYNLKPHKILSNVEAFYLGGTHSAAVTLDGELYTWGDNSCGQLGDGTQENRNLPTKIMSDVKTVSLGVYHSGALKTNGDLYMWGANNSGAIGNGEEYNCTLTPVKILSNMRSIELSDNKSSAISNLGELYIWGSHCFGGGATIKKPKKIMDNISHAYLSDDSHDVCAAISENGQLFVWDRTTGPYNTEDESDVGTPKELLSNVKHVDISNNNILAVLNDGSLYAWGNNEDGQVGNGTTERQDEPIMIFENVRTATISRDVCGLVTNNNQVYMWGYNRYGYLGDGTTKNRLIPTLIQYNPRQTSNKDSFYLSITDNAVIDKELTISGSLKMFSETENIDYDSVINKIDWKSSDLDIIDVSNVACNWTTEKFDSEVSIWLHFTVVPKKAGIVTLTASTESGIMATKKIVVEPELMVEETAYYVNQKAEFTICNVSLKEANKDYLDNFMSSLVVENTTVFLGMEYSNDYEISDDGFSAKLKMSIDPFYSYDDLYTFQINSPGGQVKKIKIHSAVGNHLWSDEDHQITTEDIIMSKAEKEYLVAFDEFIDKIYGIMEKNADEVTESVDNLSAWLKEEYGAVITNIPDNMKIKGWDNYLYDALSSKIADVANAKMSDISYSTDAVTLGANLVKAVFKDFKYIKDSIEYKDKKGGNIVIEMSITAQYGLYTGSITCRDAQNPSENYTLGIYMTNEHMEKALKQYANDLAKLGASAANSVYYAMAEDLLGKSLKDFTAEFLKKYAAKYGRKLTEIGLGGLIEFCSAGYDVYKDVNTFSKTLSNKDITQMYSQLKDSKEALDSFSDSATDKNVKRASGKVVKAAEKILLLWEEYITTGTVTLDGGIKGWIKSVFTCPVSILVCDVNSKEIGYVGNDDIWYNNSIFIREQGDAKIIYTPFDEQVTFKIDGTGYGTLSCSFEEYGRSGNILGRLNYYNIPISPDTKITTPLPSENLIAEHSDMAIYVDGNAFFPDKCISVDEYKNAGISVALKTNNADGGIVYGAGNYILGDTVNLVALSKEGYIFTGWYDEGDMLVSIKRNIEFAATKNIDYTAHFDSIPDNSFVDDTKDVLVQSISIQQSITMQNSKKLQLDAKVLPENASNKNLKWSSSNANIAKVDQNGLVTAVGIGEVSIIAESTDGSNVSASCVITVTKAGNVTPPEKDDVEDNPSGNNTGDNLSNGTATGSNSSGSGIDNSNGNPSGDNGQPDDSIQIKLLYYIVEFNANAGSKLSRKTMTLLNDDNLGILPKVQRKNYIFNGWYTQKIGGTKVNSSTVLNAGTTLFAQWRKVDKPSKVKSLVLKSAKPGALTVGFQKMKEVKGYEIAYSINKKLPLSSTKKIVSSSANKTIKNLKSNKKYYIRVRAYKLDSTGKKVYGAYSTVKSIKVK